MKFIPTLLTGILIAVTCLSFGQSIHINTAKVVAQNHLLSIGGNQLKSASLNRAKPQFSSFSVTSESKDTLYYVFNDTINHSFVIVSGDKRSMPIIGYSLEGNYDVNNQPPAFVAWMESREKEIASIKQNNIQADSKIKEQWDLLLSANAQEPMASLVVEPLLKTRWDQGCYYNSKCPSVNASSYCGHAPTGCTATAMAQIMKYWNYPTTGTGSHSYLSAGYGILSADFGSTTYQWDQMPNELTSENDAVATLMYQCGVALDTKYAQDGSGAYDPRDELVNYFNYSPFAEYIDKRSYLPKDWVELLKSELNEGRPIWYNGANSPCGGGHAFVCDGYRDFDYFHFNWGWGGSFDGYFTLGSLNPGTESYSLFQAAIIKIFPKSLPDGYKGILLSTKTVGMGINGGMTKVDINSSEPWTASSDQAWLTIDPGSGTTGNHTIIFTAKSNPTADSRIARVTISASGFTPQTIIVTQYSRLEVTPGNLKSILGSQLSTTTSLTLQGSIDSRDFKTMRSEMPALTDIDLRDVTIASYTGTEGTIGEESYTYPANEIPNFAFQFPQSNRAKSRLQSIILPLSISAINDYAFQGCRNLSIQNIPTSVLKIGNGAFLECNFSKPVIIPSSVSYIGSAAFKGFKGEITVDTNNANYSSLDGVLFNKTRTKLIQCPVSKTGDYLIPSTVTSIGSAAFFGCSALTTVAIPTSVTAIEGYAFNYCTGLTSITIPSSVTTIGQRVFGGFTGSIDVDSKNSKFSSLEGVLFNKDQTELIQCPVSKSGTYTIPGTVTIVQMEAFHSCKNISSIIIPESVKSIGSFAFNCVGLNSIYSYAVSPVNLESSPYTFCEVNVTQCVLYVPFGTKALYAEADQWRFFSNMIEMPGLFVSDKKVDISRDGGTAIVNLASNVSWTATCNQDWLTLSAVSGVAGCSKINLTAPANPTISLRKATVTISATGYTTQTIEVIQYETIEATPGNLKTILGRQLSTITSLTLKGTIDARDFKTMRDEMKLLSFLDLSDVKIVEYTGTEGTIGTNKFFYPANKIPDQAFLRNVSLKHVTIGSSITSIGELAFFCCKHLNTVTIPASVTSIEREAFRESREMTRLTIPSSVTFIGSQVFQTCSALIEVALDNTKYSSIDGVLFNKTQTELIQYPVSKPGNYKIPSSVISIGDQAFWGSTELISVTIPSSVTTIRNYAFCESSKLAVLTIPSSVTFIGNNVFELCNALIDVSPDNQIYSSINGVIFNKSQTQLIHCPPSITGNYVIPASVKSIADWAFSRCHRLTSLSIPSSIISIGTYAFFACDSLNSIYASGSSPASLNSSPDVFTFVNKEKTVLKVPFGSKSNYQTANQWKDFTNIVEINPPIADAGNDVQADENSTVILDGSASSDPDNGQLTYYWTVPAGIILSSNTVAKPTFKAPEVPKDSSYTFALTVSNNKIYSSMDQVVVTVKQINKAPVANAGIDKEITGGRFFQLDGSQSSDFDNDALIYKWIAPTNINLNSTSVAMPTFKVPEVDAITTFTFSLIVNDGNIDSPADQVTVVVIPNKAPIANAGVDQQVIENHLFILDGSASSDPDNDQLTYYWTAPAGIILSSNIAVKPTFTTPEVPEDSSYTFLLKVFDGKIYSMADPVIVSVRNVDRAPYLKSTISNISVERTAPDKIIELPTIFADDDLSDVLSYRVSSNTNEQVVTTAISGRNLTLSFSTQHSGISEITITANSNGKEVSCKFNVEVKIPTKINSLESAQPLRIFPNPTNGKVKVITDQRLKIGSELIVNDINGKTIQKKVIREKEEWVDLTGQTPGIYLIKINIGNTYIQKVILK